MDDQIKRVANTKPEAERLVQEILEVLVKVQNADYEHLLQKPHGETMDFTQATTAILAAVARDRQDLLDKVEGLVGGMEDLYASPDHIVPDTEIATRNGLRAELRQGIQKLREG